MLEPYSDSKAGPLDVSIRDRNRDSMFGTMLISSGMSKAERARVG